MKLEPLETSQYYHFFNRGNNSETIFFEEENYSYFLKLMKKYLLQIADVYSYCLLSNHFHFIIRIKDNAVLTDKYKEENNNIHQPISNMLNAYTKAINKKYNRVGSLFQKHPKRILIQNEKYLKNLILYVNTNSTHHNICDFEKYKHSSYQALISNNPTLLKRNEVIELFNDIENFKYNHNLKSIKIDVIKDLLLE